MSAGIIVMNKNAIAMAADSAVTIGDHAVIHNSVNKLFALSSFEPIGAIIYSNSQFMQVPMEIIIKQYKLDLGKKSFPTLQEYVDDFIDFISNNCELFHFDKNEETFVLHTCYDLLTNVHKGFLNRAKELIEKHNRPLTEVEELEIRKQATDELLSFVKSQTIVRNDFSGYVERVYLKNIVSCIENTVSWITEKEIIAKAICKIFDTNYTSLGYVGIAISGYGKKDIFPHMIHLRLSGIINHKLRYEKLETADISEDNNASIIPLAQTDVIRTFIQGYNDNFLEQINQDIPLIIENRLRNIPNSELDDNNKNKALKAFRNVQEEIVKKISIESVNVFVRPIIESISSLPIEELSLFAESMINITSVRRRVAIDGNIGTVGGPIDVAVVTRGDGFIWLKRKHYFEAKKNPQFMYSRYGQPIREMIDDVNS